VRRDRRGAGLRKSGFFTASLGKQGETMSLFPFLRANYPKDDPCDARNEKGELLFKNQCAIRVGHALKKSGISLGSFPPTRKCWIHKNQDHILAAKELADWLDKGVSSQIAKSRDITGESWRSKVLDKKGIICFEDYYPASNGSGGDHIDLWDGSSLTGLGSWLRTRFSIVVPGYWSDFRKAKRIRFFEVK
jgi:hypothetical protein